MKPHGESRKTARKGCLEIKLRHGARWSILRLIQRGFIRDFAAHGTPLQAISTQGQALPADGGAQKIMDQQVPFRPGF
jgi:hypothetical protein